MTDPETTIRRARAADLPAVGRLGALLLRAHHEFDRDRFMPAGADAEDGYAAFLATELESPETLVLERAGFIHDVLVDEGSRRAGIADALIDAAIRWMREIDVPRVMLWTASRNDQAQRMFARKGFRATMQEMTLEL